MGGTVCGDSVVTLARIGWVDALARKKLADLDTFERLLLAPLQRDLVDSTWLFERYDSSGTQIRTSFYFEYPSLVAIMLREVRYGVNIGLSTVEVAPFPAQPFVYALGAVKVTYGPDFVSLSLPGDANLVQNKKVSVKNVKGDATYLVANSCSNSGVTAVSDSTGTLAFSAVFTTGCVVTATLQ